MLLRKRSPPWAWVLSAPFPYIITHPYAVPTQLSSTALGSPMAAQRIQSAKECILQPGSFSEIIMYKTTRQRNLLALLWLLICLSQAALRAVQTRTVSPLSSFKRITFLSRGSVDERHKCYGGALSAGTHGLMFWKWSRVYFTACSLLSFGILSVWLIHLISFASLRTFGCIEWQNAEASESVFVMGAFRAKNNVRGT